VWRGVGLVLIAVHCVLHQDLSGLKKPEIVTETYGYDDEDAWCGMDDDATTYDVDDVVADENGTGRLKALE